MSITNKILKESGDFFNSNKFLDQLSEYTTQAAYENAEVLYRDNNYSKNKLVTIYQELLHSNYHKEAEGVLNFLKTI